MEHASSELLVCTSQQENITTKSIKLARTFYCFTLTLKLSACWPWSISISYRVIFALCYFHHITHANNFTPSKICWDIVVFCESLI